MSQFRALAVYVCHEGQGIRGTGLHIGLGCSAQGLIAPCEKRNTAESEFAVFGFRSSSLAGICIIGTVFALDISKQENMADLAHSNLKLQLYGPKLG